MFTKIIRLHIQVIKDNIVRFLSKLYKILKQGNKEVPRNFYYTYIYI